MCKARVLPVLLLLGLSAPLGARAEPVRLVVFDVEDTALAGSARRGDALTVRVRRRVGAERRFRVVPSATVEAAVRAAGRQRCTFPLCQSEILRALDADLGLSLLVFRAGEECAAAARYFDRLTRPAAPVAVRLGPCTPIEELVDAALDGLLGERPEPPPRRAPKTTVDPEVARRREATGLAREGRALIAEGKLEEARRQLKACLRAFPLPSCHRSLGVLEARAERREAAIEHYRAYLELRPGAPDAAEVRAIIDEAER